MAGWPSSLVRAPGTLPSSRRPAFTLTGSFIHPTRNLLSPLLVSGNPAMVADTRRPRKEKAGDPFSTMSAVGDLNTEEGSSPGQGLKEGQDPSRCSGD